MNTIHAFLLGASPLFAYALIGIFVYLSRDKFAQANEE